jgi:hypothetical protein
MASSLLPSNALDRIARQQAKMLRAVDEGRWPFKLYSDKPVKRAGKPLSPFDELAGKLMAEARPRRGANGRLADAEYAAIAVGLDNAGFKPLDHVEGVFRKQLAEWNQKHPRTAIHTFTKAFAHSQHRRGVHKLLNRAEAKWRKQRLS